MDSIDRSRLLNSLSKFQMQKQILETTIKSDWKEEFKYTKINNRELLELLDYAIKGVCGEAGAHI